MTSPLTWQASKVRGIIERDEAHVWAWSLDPTPADLTEHVALLDEAEQQRMQRFYFAPDRARYAVAHASMRQILSAYLHLAPRSIAFRTGALGKPELAEDATSLSFSLSHSKTVGALAVVREGPVGLDVEDVRPIEPDVANSFFSPAEIAELGRLEGHEWLPGFYQCWTRKEAILKGEGVGLHRALDGFDVSLSPGAPAALLGTRSPFSHVWTLHDVPPSSGTMGALATVFGDAKVSLFRFAE